MNKNRKISLITTILLVVVLLIVGVSYAVFTFNRTGGTSKLIAGDIYMRYNETNQLVLSDAMPTNIDKHMRYIVNPIIATQEIMENELTRCIEMFKDWGYENDGNFITYCKGTGTWGNFTFQMDLDDSFYNDAQLQEMLSSNIIVQDGENYIVNPVMATQEIMENELTRCINLYTDMGIEEVLDSGSDVESYCKGIGTAYGGLTIQEELDEWISRAESESTIEEGFLYNGGQELIDAGIIIQKIENLPYFEFTISGKNTYTKNDIWYEIVLSHGDSHAMRTTRIRDDLLKFTLVEVKDNKEKIIINNKKYNDLTNKRIWVDTIPKNINEEIEITYRLYMWIDGDVKVGNVNQDYTIEEWNDIFTSIKVNVSGDFSKKEVAYEDMYDVTDTSCFETIDTEVYLHNKNMTENELNSCITFFSNNSDYEFDEGTTAESFCRGEGTIWDGHVIDNLLIFRDFNKSELEFFKEKNIATLEQGKEITGYNESCGSNLVIPKKINGLNVLRIGIGAFKGKNISIVVFPNNILEIETEAFYNSKLNRVVFEEISNLKAINHESFRWTNIKNITIPDSVTYLACTAFNSEVIVHKNNNLTCSEINE